MTDKLAANFCDFFALADAAVAPSSAPSSTSARDALERLFRR